MAADHVLWVTGAGAAKWIRETGLRTDAAGFIALNECFQSVSHREVFAAGDIASMLNPLLRGWIGYYGRYNRAALETMLRHVNLTLVGWAMRKFKRFQGRKVGAARFLEKLVRIQPALFEHWRIGMIGAFA